MATHDYNIANQGFPAFRADLNDALAAIVSNNSNATAPATTFAHQWWMDTSANPSILKVRNADNDAWITLGTFNQSTDTFTPSGVTSDKIEEGNSSVEVIDTGTGSVVITVDGTAIATFTSTGFTVDGLTVSQGAGDVATNTAVGVSALAANTTGANNTAVGYQALDANTTGQGNTAVGQGALGANTTGVQNTAVGREALGLNTTGSNNTAFGKLALYANTTGGNNTAIGWDALVANTTGANNTAVGYQALDACTTGVENTAVGAAALTTATTGTGNCAFGRNAGENLTTGSNNVLIGSNAGQGFAALTTGSNNVMIGVQSYATAGAVNQIVIGTDILVGQGDNYFTFGKTGNRVYNQYTVDANWARTSDGRLKRNVNDMSLGLSFINKLRPVSYQWKPSYEVPQELVTQYNEENKMDLDVVMHGFIAQEVKAALDEVGSTYTCGVWSEGSDGTQAVSREMFIMPLVKAVQELSAQVTALQAEVNTLKGQ